MTGKVRIVSDGTTYGTKVLVDGIQVKHVSAVHILPMSANNHGAVHAVIEVVGPDLDIVANLAHEEVITLKADAEAIQAARHDELMDIADQITALARYRVNNQKGRP